MAFKLEKGQAWGDLYDWINLSCSPSELMNTVGTIKSISGKDAKDAREAKKKPSPSKRIVEEDANIDDFENFKKTMDNNSMGLEDTENRYKLAQDLELSKKSNLGTLKGNETKTTVEVPSAIQMALSQPIEPLPCLSLKRVIGVNSARCNSVIFRKDAPNGED